MKKCPAGPENRLKSYRTAFFSLLAMTCLLLLFSLSGCVRQRGPESPPAGESSSASLSWSGQKSIESGGLERTYLVHLPPSYMKGTPTPLLIAFHGGGGDGEGMERLTHMDDVSDSAGFIAVYPDGIDRNWNDGRPEINPGVDDVGFVRDLLKQLESDYSIDAKRVYATGISDGGFMSYRLALDLDGTFAAVAPVGALMTEQLCRKPPPASPVSVLLIMGKDDPFVPWSGGDVTAGLKKRGTVVSTAATIDYWVKAESCVSQPVISELPDTDPSDGTRAREELYGGGREGAVVELIAVEGGGHTWPGGLQYLRERTIGKTSRDFDASEVIWDFFKGHNIR